MILPWCITSVRQASRAHEGHVVLDHHDGDAPRQIQHQLRRPLRLVRPHAGGRLVEQHEFWLRGERHADLEPLFLAVRERTRRLLRLLGQPEQVQDLGRASPRPLGRRSALGDADIVADGEAVEDAGRLEFPRDAEPRKRLDAAAGHVVAGKEHAPGGRAHRAGQHVEERALARAVRPDDAGDALAAERQADAGHRHDAAEAGAEVLGFGAGSRPS